MNLSAKILTPQQVSLLSYGLSFSPARHFNLFDTIVDVNRFVRHLTVRKHFLGINPDMDPQEVSPVPTSEVVPHDNHSVGAQLFPEQTAMCELQDLLAESRVDTSIHMSADFITRNPNFYPVNARSPAVDRFQELVEHDLCTLQRQVGDRVSTAKDNLTKSQRSSLQNLTHMRDIVVRRADKGGTVTILDKGLYIQENARLLSDTSTYIKLQGDPTAKYKDLLRLHINEGVCKGVITNKQAEYIIPKFPTISVFHSFPKTHKPSFPPKFRPIVSGIGSLHENLCAWVDSLLQPLIPNIPGYLKDTKYVLSTVEALTWEKTYTWITADVTSLYTVIPHDLSQLALIWFLDTYSSYSITLKDFLISTVMYLLKHNYFMFDNTFYLQISGASMGAKFSPSFANIFMAWWEKQYVFSESNPYLDSFVWYGRYIDDVIIVWRSDVSAIPNLLFYFNNNNFGLKFTMEHNSVTIPFLDLLISGNSITSRVDTVTYRKETAGNTTLHAASCHPLHTVQAIPMGELVRAKRNCSSATAFDIEKQTVCKRLKERQYPPWMLGRATEKIAHVDRESLLGNNTHKPLSHISDGFSIFSTPYSLQFKQISDIIHKYIPVLYTDPGFSEVIQKGYKCVSKKAITLGNILSPSMICSQADTKPTWLRHVGCYQCSHTRCICCQYIKKSTSFISTATNMTYPIKQYMNCSTTYVVYLFTCNLCHDQYTGSTSCSLKTRVRRHVSDINAMFTTNISAVSRHARDIHNRDPSVFTVQAIERLNKSVRGGDNIHRLRNREAYWMFVLKTCTPYGLNRRSDLILHY